MNILTDLGKIWQKRMPGQLVIQMTDHCNARCPQCGMRKTEKFRRSRLSVDRIRRILDAAAQKDIRVVSFTGGEPLLFLDDLVELMHHAGQLGIEYIRTGTNGFFFANSDRSDFESRIRGIAEKLAGTQLRNFWISIDSAVPEVHEKMRGFPGVIAGIEKALPIFQEHGLYPSANLGINRNIGGESDPFPSTDELFYQKFSSGFRKFYDFVIGLGFTMVNSCYPMSIDEADSGGLSAVYAATSVDSVVRFTRTEKALIFESLMDVIPEFRSRVRIFSPLTSLYALRQQQLHGTADVYPCRGGIDFFFIEAHDGHVYPCGYRGDDDMGDFEDLDIRGADCGKDCYLCDWECFRDPSELIGPVLQGVTAPLALIQKFRRDPEYFRIWKNDLRYYRACDFFNGRKPMNASRLAKFAATPEHGKAVRPRSQFRIYPSENSSFCHSERI